jgi:putative ABC transport system permease protein
MRDRNYLDVWARPQARNHVATGDRRNEYDRRRLEKQYPDVNDNVGIGLMRIQEFLVGDIRPTLLVLLVAVALVLVIGCANVANLLLARATTRTREVSIRAAMGASRSRIIRQLLTESILLALCGGALGVLLAAWAVPTLLSLSPSEISNFKQIGLNKEVLGFSAALSLLSGILFGLAPAWQTSGANLNESLREGERGKQWRSRANSFRAGDRGSRPFSGLANRRGIASQELYTGHARRSGLRSRTLAGIHRWARFVRRPPPTRCFLQAGSR